MSLDHETAQSRSTLIRKGSISYNFNIIFSQEHYYGLAEVSFYLERVDFTELPLDFSGTLIEDVIINDKRFMPKSTNNFLLLPRGYLQKGRNRLSVMYTNSYNNDRSGCITFEDKGEQFIYTDFEPYGANRVFPCFDQPNLKAKMKIALVTPPSWNALSNEPPKSINTFHLKTYQDLHQFEHAGSLEMMDSFIEKIELNRSKLGEQPKMTLFDFTEQLPTYIYSFAVGPYLFLSDDSGTSTVPLKLYCIPSVTFLLGEYSSFIFEITKKAMAFFENFFGEKFPFRKYDQIWVRDYASWAMQNAGLVTYNEEKMLQPYSTEDDYYNFADTLVHELSHHWFGNFVTMDWWDDLWLNESFADFIAQFVLGKINDSLERPLQPSGMYFRDRKAWGYDEDERDSGTHPIRAVVKDTDVAANNFDGITYAKGAALIKQLVSLVGEDGFSNGLKSYFNRFRWSNATIFDFLEDMAPYFPSNIDLNQWRSGWLESASVNMFESIWNPDDLSSTATLRLVQTPFSQKFPTLRWHKLQIAFFNANASVVFAQTVFVSPDSAETVVTYDGSYKVRAILVNYNDNTFCENYLDTQSLQFFMGNVDKITDTYTRAQVWYNIAQMNKLAYLKLEDYISFLESKLLDEPVEFIVNQLLTELHGLMSHYITGEEMDDQSNILFDALYRELQDMGITDYDRVTILQKFYIKYAITDAHKLQLKKWLMKEDPTIAARDILDQTLPWNIVKKVFTISDSLLSRQQKEEAYDYNYQLDKSARADEARKVCDNIVCTKEEFDQTYQHFRQDKITLSERYILIQGWKNKYHQAWVNQKKDQYFADLITLSDTLSYSFFEFFYTELRPIDTDYQSQIARYNSAIETLAEDPQKQAHVINLRKIVDDLTLYTRNTAFNSDSNRTLSQERAVVRRSWIKEGSLNYTVHIGFESMATTRNYTGLTQMVFELNEVPHVLPIDFKTIQVFKMVVNGFNITPWLVGEYLMVPRLYLQLGVNNIGVYYKNELDNDGLGCCMFIDESDPATDRYYTYTQFEPHSAHRLFPCFDQPDLKATMSMNVIFPTGWVAVSNETNSFTGNFSSGTYTPRVPTSVSKLLPTYLIGKTGRFSTFVRTQLLPTYLYALACGNYVSIALEDTKRYNNIPMTIYSLYSYQSLLTYYKDFIFQLTKLSLQFYETKLGIGYQFSKYDTIFCHEYSAGAMENPGLVTFTDFYLYESPSSNQHMLRFADTITHEAAHHWFGDYVTMKWWDDLWLNQSFADYMSFYCMESIRTQVTTLQTYSSGWLNAIQRSQDGFRDDQYQSTTHSMRPNVPNTSKTFFDGITYRKGFMVLRQLNYLIGDGNFFNGVKAYLNAFGFKNATADDFLNSMSPYFKPNVADYTINFWRDTWLLAPSFNVLSVEWDPNSTSTTAELKINQRAYSQSYPTLRYHKVIVSFIRANGTVTNKVVVIDDSPQTIVTYNGNDGYQAILVNSDFYSYVKCEIDTFSLSYFIANINKVGTPLRRMCIWFHLNEMVKDCTRKVLSHKDMILNNLPGEADDSVYDFVLSFLNTSTGSYLPSYQVSAARSSCFDFVLQQLTTITQASKQSAPWYHLQLFQRRDRPQELRDTPNRRMLLKDALVSFCTTSMQLDTLNQWRQGLYVPLQPYPITIPQAFSVVKKIYMSNDFTSNQKLAIYDAEKGKYPGNTATLTKNTVEVIEVNDSSVFDAVYLIFTDQEESLAIKGSRAEGWNNPVHISWLVNIYRQRIFTDIYTVSQALTPEHFKFFYSSLAPIDDDFNKNIALYQAVNLKGPEMVGHMYNIKKIVEGYKFRQTLQQYNQ